MNYNHNYIHLLQNPNGSPAFIKTIADTEEDLFEYFKKCIYYYDCGNKYSKEGVSMFSIELNQKFYTLICNRDSHKELSNNTVIIPGPTLGDDVTFGRSVIITSEMTTKYHFRKNGLSEEDMNIILSNARYTIYKGIPSFSLYIRFFKSIPYKLLEDE